MRIIEAKQTLEDCISAQEFSRAAELKDSIMELENHRNLILQEIAESNQPADKEVRTEKVHNQMGSSATVCPCYSTSVLSDFPGTDSIVCLC